MNKSLKAAFAAGIRPCLAREAVKFRNQTDRRIRIRKISINLEPAAPGEPENTPIIKFKKKKETP